MNFDFTVFLYLVKFIEILLEIFNKLNFTLFIIKLKIEAQRDTTPTRVHMHNSQNAAPPAPG